MTVPRIDVSIVVPTRNRANLLPRLLSALDQQDFGSYEIIVVDDNSVDATPLFLDNWSGDRRIVVRLGAPVGSYGARNEGWRRARGDIVAFTDDDCLPEPGWLSALTRAFEDPALVGVQGVTLPTPGVITPFTHQIEHTSGGVPYRTCNIAYRRQLLEATFGFDASLRWYADNLLGLRMVRLGPIDFAADAVVHHPPRPKEWRDREEWLARFRADASYRSQLHQLQGSSVPTVPLVLPVILWIVRPLVTQSLHHVRYVFAHPRRYLRDVQPMLREKGELFSALLAHCTAQPGVNEYRTWQTLSREPRVSAIVVTRDRPDMLAGALASLTRQTWRNTELIVVDHDPSGTAARWAEEVNAVYIHAPHMTLGSARRRGVEAAAGEILAFTDDDCQPATDWIENAVDGFKRHPELAGLQGRTTAQAGPIGTRAIAVNRPDGLYRTCNIAYRSEALALSGGFDGGFIGWLEDTALAARVLAVGGAIGWEPRMVVTHRAVARRGLTRQQWRDLIHDEYLLNTSYRAFYRRNRGAKPLMVVIGRWLIGSPIKALLRSLPQALTDPVGYLKVVKLLLAERAGLLAVLTSTRSRK